jgi:hypothetical protein
MRNRLRQRQLALFLALCVLVAACVSRGPSAGALHRWWAGFGPVVSHDDFPADCKLCHVGEDRWDELRPDFKFDHEAQTGVPLNGAHSKALCLRCHNDRGPVAIFNQRGCAGCHEDIHQGDLGQNCTMCHQESTWAAVGQIEMHNRTRFPLTGAHLQTSCVQCHPGARVGNFVPNDTECLTCHADDLAAALNPPHLALGWIDTCQRCHITTKWEHAQIDQAAQRAR